MHGVDYGLSGMNLLGLTCGGKEYPTNDSANWRRNSNGNPENMLQLVRNLFPEEEILFIIQRDFNRNVLVYKTAFGEDDELDVSKLVEAFWLIIDNPVSESNLGDVHTENLTLLERNLAYGATVGTDENGYFITIKALGEPIRIFQHDDDLRTGMMVKGHLLMLEKVDIYTVPRALCWPLVIQMDLALTDLETGARCTYHFSPK